MVYFQIKIVKKLFQKYINSKEEWILDEIRGVNNSLARPNDIEWYKKILSHMGFLNKMSPEDLDILLWNNT